MQQIFTQQPKRMTNNVNKTQGCRVMSPNKQTIAVLKQFARAYMPTAIVSTPLVLN